MACTRARGAPCDGDNSPDVRSVMVAPLLLVANANGFGVSGEAFGFSQEGRRRAECAHSLCRILLHGDELYEIVDAEAATHSRHAAGGQSVIGAGDVIARSEEHTSELQS